MTAEHNRLEEARKNIPWKKWEPYLSERQWGTVREDYSDSGDAWNYFSHDQARSRAYRWGEDGLAGISDDRQHDARGIIARLMHLFGSSTAEQFLEIGAVAAAVRVKPKRSR